MADSRTIHADEYAALAELRFLIRRFLAFSEAASREAGLEPQQHQLLLVLKGLRPPMRPTIRTVAERLLIQHNSAVELVGRSVERGLVKRFPAEHDRREVALQITLRGERILRRLTLAHRAELRTSAPRLVEALEGMLADRPATPRARRVRTTSKKRASR
jgi:DNA-binding MarR family transcriptional regulator